MVFTTCAEHLGGGWAVQQRGTWAGSRRNGEVKPGFLIQDRDRNFPAAFHAVFQCGRSGGHPNTDAGPERERSVRALDLQCP